MAENERRKLPSVLAYAPLVAGAAIAGREFRTQFSSSFNNPVNTVRESVRSIQKKVIGSLGQPRTMFQTATQQSGDLLAMIQSSEFRAALAESPEAAAEAFRSVMINPSFYQIKESMETGIAKATELLKARQTTALSEFVVKQVSALGPGAISAFKTRYQGLSGSSLGMLDIGGIESSLRTTPISEKSAARYLGALRRRVPELSSLEGRFGVSAKIAGVVSYGSGATQARWGRLSIEGPGMSPLTYHIPLNKVAGEYRLVGESPSLFSGGGIIRGTIEKGDLSYVTGKEARRAEFGAYLKRLSRAKGRGGLGRAHSAAVMAMIGEEGRSSYFMSPVTHGQRVRQPLLNAAVQYLPALEDTYSFSPEKAAMLMGEAHSGRIAGIDRGTHLEYLGAEQLVTGKFVLPKEFRIDGSSLDISQQYVNSPEISRVSRIFQNLRENSFHARPELNDIWAMNRNGPGYSLVAMDPARRAGMGGVFDRFYGVSHTVENDKIMRRTGYMTPYATTIHISGKGAISEAALKAVKEKFSLGDGEFLVRAIMNQTGTEVEKFDKLWNRALQVSKEDRGKAVRVLRRQLQKEGFGNVLEMEMPFSYKMMLPGAGGTAVMSKNVADLIAGGKFAGKTIPRGAYLGVGEAGERISTLDVPFARQEFSSVSRAGGYLEVTGKTIVDPLEAMKFYHEARNTAKFRRAKEMKSVIGQLFGTGLHAGGAQGLSKSAVDVAFLRDISTSTEVITYTSKAAKGETAFVAEQMVGGFAEVLGRRAAYGGRAGIPALSTAGREWLDVMLQPAMPGGAPSMMASFMKKAQVGEVKEIPGAVIKAMSGLGLSGSEVGLVSGLWATTTGNLATIGATFGEEAKTWASIGAGRGWSGFYMGEPGTQLNRQLASLEKRNIEWSEYMMKDPRHGPKARLLYEENLSHLVTPERKAVYDSLRKMLGSTLGEEVGARGLREVSLGEAMTELSGSTGWLNEEAMIRLPDMMIQSAGDVKMPGRLYLPGASQVAPGGTMFRTGEGRLLPEASIASLQSALHDLSQLKTGASGDQIQRALMGYQDTLKDLVAEATIGMQSRKNIPFGSYEIARSIMIPQLYDDIGKPVPGAAEMFHKNLADAKVLTRVELLEGHKMGADMAFMSTSSAKELLNRSEAELKSNAWWLEEMSAEEMQAIKGRFQGAAGLTSLQKDMLGRSSMTYRQAWMQGLDIMPATVLRMPGAGMGSQNIAGIGLFEGEGTHILMPESEELAYRVGFPNTPSGVAKDVRFGKWAQFRSVIGEGMRQDVDADTVQVLLSLDKNRARDIKNLVYAGRQEAANAYLQDVGLAQYLRSEIGGAFQSFAERTAPAAGGAGAEEQLLAERMKQAIIMGRSKQIGPISERGRFLRRAMLQHGAREESAAMFGLFYTELEETGALKLKKYRYPISVGPELAEALRGMEVREAGDIGKFASILEELFKGSPIWDQGSVLEIRSPVQGKLMTHTRSIMPVREMLEDLGRAVKGYVAGEEFANWSVIMSGDASRASARQVYEASGQFGILGDIRSSNQFTREVSGVLDKIGLESMANAVDRVKLPKKWAAPLMIGLGATGLLAMAVGTPGYSGEALVPPGVQLDPNVQKAIQDGTILMASKPKDITPESLQPQYTGGGPSANPLLASPVARLTSTGSSVWMKTYGDHYNSRIDRFLGGLSHSVNNANINTRVRDDRQPLSVGNL